MGNTLSRCGNRVQEFVTCSRNAKPDENSETKSSPCDRKGRKKKVQEQLRKPEAITKAEISLAPKETNVATPVTALETAQETVLKDSSEDQKSSPENKEKNESLNLDDGSHRFNICIPLSEVEKVVENDEKRGISDLERRQEAILQRLGELTQEVQKLAKESGVSLLTPSTSAAQTRTTTNNLHKTGVIEDLVVSVDPDRPPLSLFVCLHLLQQQQKVLASAHVHSSVREIDPGQREMFRNGPQRTRNDYDYAFTVVWKKEKRSPSLMVDPHRQALITGEANIARYLARLLSPAYDSGDIIEATVVDTWLDTATHQLLNGNSKEKAAAIRNLNSRLGKNDWLASSSMSLADIVTWSAVFQSGQAESAPANVKKWLNSCSNLPAFQLDKCLFR